MKKINLAIVILILVLTGLVGCGKESKNETVLNSLTITAAGETTINEGETLQLTAYGKYSDNSEKSENAVWSSSPAAIASVDGNGKVTGISAGTAIITAEKEGKKSAKTIIVKAVTKPLEFSWGNATVYFVMTDRFKNGDQSNDKSYGRIPAEGQTIGTFHGGDFKGLTDKVQEGYFNNLGVNAIWITSPLEQIHGWVGGGNGDFQHYAYAGYYNMDYTEIDANMGTKDELKTFIDSAHEKGIRVIFDVVLNHTGYAALDDMREFGFMPLKKALPDTIVKPSDKNWHWYHDVYIDYTSAKQDEWAKWWGGSWLRAGLPGYPPAGNTDLTLGTNSLPDFITEAATEVEIPPFLQKKWGVEKTNSIVNSMTRPKTVRNYLVKWLSDWVREYGIDGFRCDTAKHVEKEGWADLKDQASLAFEEWKAKNPAKATAYGAGKFWTTGENIGMGLSLSSDYYTTGKFDSMINFTFMSSVSGALANAANIDAAYSAYASAVNAEGAKGNILSYISSHDTNLFFKDYSKEEAAKQKLAGTILLMVPGAVQIFYGDEAGRSSNLKGQINTSGIACTDNTQYTRSDMNWETMNNDILTHWQKVGKFREKHLAVGEGVHNKISTNPYTFSRIKGDDKIVCVMGTAGDVNIDVSTVFSDDTIVTDYYTGKTYTVKNGKVAISANDNMGTILLEK